MSLALGNMFRYAIKTESELVTLEQELRHVQDYVAIQSIRFDNRFHLSVTIPEELYELKVLKLILQPLVENALYHGIKNKRGGGCIVLRGYEDRKGLGFEVEDEGIGMDEAELAAVRAKLTLEPEEELAPIGSGGFGLHNVAQRIQMYYGDQAEILVESEKNIGTCFKVYLGNQKKS